MKLRLLTVVAFSMAVTLSVPRPSTAQDLGLRLLGIRGGVSLNPDQFHFGAFADIGQLTSWIRLQPSVELGRSDDRFLHIHPDYRPHPQHFKRTE